MTLENHLNDGEWTTGTNASTYMIGNPDILENPQRYLDNNFVLVCDGTIHEIIHVGDIFIGSSASKVPNLSKNLLFVGKLTHDYLNTCEFYDVIFTIKENSTNRVLLTG